MIFKIYKHFSLKFNNISLRKQTNCYLGIKDIVFFKLTNKTVKLVFWCGFVFFNICIIIVASTKN